MIEKQMVSLYKDPDGARVFAAQEMELHTQVTSVALPTYPRTLSWINHKASSDSLRKRVKTLENAIEEYKVAIYC